MSINKKPLYEEFIKINLKYRCRILDFINDNCPVAPKKRDHILFEKIRNYKPKNQSDIEKKKERILKNIRLQDFNKVTGFNNCKSCDLCKYETFGKVRKMLSEMMEDILLGKIPAEKTINGFIEENNHINFKIVRNAEGEFLLQKGDTLKKIIYFDFIEDIPKKLNALFQEQNEYFKQIAKLLLVNNDFVKGLEIIRNKYFKPREYKGYIVYYTKKEFSKMFIEFQNEILGFRKKYNLEQRWGPYILQGMLIYPTNDNGGLIVPDDQPIPRPPSGEPGRLLSFIKGKQLPQKLILVGDESRSEVKAFAKRYGIKAKDYKRTKEYKRPLRNFNRNFRWYKIYQNKLKNRGAIKRDTIFSEIFLNDILEYPDDWQEPDYIKYYNIKKGLSQESILDDELERIEIKGLNLIKRIIYKLDRIVKKKEK